MMVSLMILMFVDVLGIEGFLIVKKGGFSVLLYGRLVFICVM